MSRSTASHRLIEVDADRAPRWVAGFAERHGEVVVSAGEDGVHLSAADGAVAVLEPAFGALPGEDAADDLVDALVRDAGRERHVALLLVRRGGFAVGLGRGRTLSAHKVGTRYVQGRTAAGGWSQQRFARRREGQTAGLVGAATEAAHAVWGSVAVESLVVGGDRLLVLDVLADPRLARVAALPRTPVLPVPDPRLDVLREALRRARCVRVHLTEPGDPA